MLAKKRMKGRSAYTYLRSGTTNIATGALQGREYGPTFDFLAGRAKRDFLGLSGGGGKIEILHTDERAPRMLSLYL